MVSYGSKDYTRNDVLRKGGQVIIFCHDKQRVDNEFVDSILRGWYPTNIVCMRLNQLLKQKT